MSSSDGVPSSSVISSSYKREQKLGLGNDERMMMNDLKVLNMHTYREKKVQITQIWRSQIFINLKPQPILYIHTYIHTGHQYYYYPVTYFTHSVNKCNYYIFYDKPQNLCTFLRKMPRTTQWYLLQVIRIFSFHIKGELKFKFQRQGQRSDLSSTAFYIHT